MTVVFDAASSLTSDDAESTITVRQVIPAAQMAAATGTHFRISFKQGSGGVGSALTEMYFGRATTSGDAYDAQELTRVTWGSATTMPNDPNGTTVSDWMLLPVGYDEASNYIVSFYVGTASGNNFKIGTVTGNQAYYAAGANGASSLGLAGYSSSTAGLIFGVAAIEIGSGTFAQGDLLGFDTAAGGTGANPNNCAISPNITVEAGDVIFVSAGQQTTREMSGATDNLGNTYVSAGTPIDAGTAGGTGLYSIVTAAGALSNVAVSGQTTTANDFAIAVGMWRGPFEVDKTVAMASDALTPFACPATGTLAQASELVIAYGVVGTAAAAVAATSPMILAGQVANSTTIRTAISYKIVSATTDTTPEFTGTSANAGWGTATFKIVSAAVPASLLFKPGAAMSHMLVR